MSEDFDGIGITSEMSSPSSVWPVYNSGEVVDEPMALSQTDEPFPFLGQLLRDTGIDTDTSEPSNQRKADDQSRRHTSEDGKCASVTSQHFSTPTKGKRTERQHATPQTDTDASSLSLPSEGSLTGGASPNCGTTVTELFENISSFLGNGTDITTPPLSSHHDLAITSSQHRQHLPDFSLHETEREALLKEKKHLSFFAYGRMLTIASFVFAFAAIILAIVSKRSLRFAKLGNPIEVSPQLDLVEYVGLVNMQLCYNDTASDWAYRRVLEIADSPDTRLLSVVSAPSSDVGQGVNTHEQHGCFSLLLTIDTIDDVMWNLSRTFLSLAIVFGFFLTVMLLSAMYWESINLKPVAIGLLVTYFFQSLSFFFFDSDLCREYKCHLSEGSITSIVASLFWFLSGLCCIRMDVLYQTQQRRWIRRRDRALKKLRLQRMLSEVTDLATATTDTEDVQPATPERRNLTSIFDEGFRVWTRDDGANSSNDDGHCDGKLFEV